MTAARLILCLAAAEIGIVGLVYLVSPATMLAPAGLVPDSVNGFHAARAAYGGAFAGFALFWLAGVLRAPLRRPALMSLAVFMAAFAFGRLVSLAVDGLPSAMFLGALATELLLAPAALWAVRSEGVTKP